MLKLDACAKTQSKLFSAAWNNGKGSGPVPAISTRGADPRHVFLLRRHPIQIASTTNNNAVIENGTMAGVLKGDYEQAYLATRYGNVLP